MIDKRSFYDETIFTDEMRRLFRDGYVFAGLASELGHDRDFVTISYRGDAVVVQNFKGELRAFQNVCAHQFAKVQHEPRGNRLLMCRYHGWNYDGTGYPFGIPKRSEYKLEGVLRECLSLKPYRVETCGLFVFVSATDCPVTLRDFLGGFWDTLEMLSRHIGPDYHFSDIPHLANWKLLVENVLDNYHCATLHRESFLSDGFCLTPPEELVIDGPHSSFHVPRTATADEKHESLRRRLRSHLTAREFIHESYFHIFIFPNLFIASTEGTTFYVGQALPIAPDQTDLRVRYLEPALDVAPRHRAKQDLVNQVTSENGLKIIVEEDLPVLETVQQGIKLSELPGFIGAGEERLCAWRASYNLAMADGIAATLPLAQVSKRDAKDGASSLPSPRKARDALSPGA